MVSYSALVVPAGTLGRHKHACGKDLRGKRERGAEDTSPAAIDAYELWLLAQLPAERAYELAATAGAVMARHWVLWAGDHGVPIDLPQLFEPDSEDKRRCSSNARTWAATTGVWLAANDVGVAVTDSSVHIATSNQAIVVVSWHADSHHSLVRRVVGECHQRKWGMIKRVHGKLPQLPASVAAAVMWLAAFQVDADVLYNILRMLLCFQPVQPRKETESKDADSTEAPEYPRNLAVESLECDYDGSILAWLSFHNFGSKATEDDAECEGMALSKALFPPEVHSGLVEQWRRVQCHGPALDFFEYLLLVEVMSG